MNWKGRAYCLSSKQIIGRVISLKDIQNDKRDGDVLLADKLLVDEVLPILDKKIMTAVVVKSGSLADHTAVLLNGKDIQLAVAPSIPHVDSGTPIFIDGKNEKIIVHDKIDDLKDYQNSKEKKERYMQTEKLETIIYSGKVISVNVDGKTAEELLSGLRCGATGIGILRTEWLDWNKSKYPDEKTHCSIYEECIQKVAPHRLNIRLFDLGGDKIPLWAKPYSEFLNSPLGARGIRAIDYLHEAFKAQLKAICNVAENAKLGIVIPMVTDVNDIRYLKEILFQLASKRSINNITIGSMIEVPSAAIEINKILGEVDFIRIGPGDLTQFCLAKLRSNLSPIELSGSSMHPSLIKLIRNINKQCKNKNKAVSICLDSEPRSVLLKKLLLSGICTFCVSPKNVPITKTRLRDIINKV